MQEIHASQVRPPFYRDERILGIFRVWPVSEFSVRG